MPTATEAHRDPRPTLERPDDDPYLWLEEVDGPDALTWVEARNAETLARYGDATFLRDRDIARDLLDRPSRIPFVRRFGTWLYNFWTDAEHPRGLWRRVDEAGYRVAVPDWELLLDLDRLATVEEEDWVWAGAAILKGDLDRALVRLSRGGKDAAAIREFDLNTRTFVADGFILPEGKGGATWLDRDTVLLSSALGPGMATRSGYARTVRLWTRGLDPLDAPVLFETVVSSMDVWGASDRQTGTERITVVERLGFFDAAVHIGDRGGMRVRLDLPTHAGVQLHRNHLSVRLRRPWTVDGVTHDIDTVLTIALPDLLAGNRAFTVLWRPDERLALQGVFWSAGRLIVDVLENLSPTYRVFEPRPGGWAERPLAGLPALGSVHLWPLDGDPERADGALLALAHDPVTPPALLAFPPALDAPTVLRQAPPAFDTRNIRVTRHEARSADGTLVPYVQVGPEAKTGAAPVYLTAYGGFGHSPLPSYQPVMGRLWLERGGTCVTANIRGGGEFGTRRNADAAALNARVRAALRAEGRLGPDLITLPARDRADKLVPLAIAVGDALRFGESLSHLGLRNGNRARVEAITAEPEGGARLRLALEDGRVIEAAWSDLAQQPRFGRARPQPKIVHAYAGTVYAAQGRTCAATVMYLGAGTDAREVYVGLTRHRHEAQVVIERDRPDALCRQRQADPRMPATDAMVLERLFREARTYREKANVADYAADRVAFVRDGLLGLRERVVPGIDVRRAARAARALREAAAWLGVERLIVPAWRVIDAYGRRLTRASTSATHALTAQLARRLGHSDPERGRGIER